MKHIRKNNPGLLFLINFWSKYCLLQDWHVEWAKNHIKVLSALKKGQQLYLEGERQKNVYLVARGLLARVRYDDSGKRQILSVALPGMALMSTYHLYSQSPSVGDIVVLRPDTLIVQIPYSAIRLFKEKEPHIDTLIDVLGNKKKTQISQMLRIVLCSNRFDRCIRCAKENPTLFLALYQNEIADMLQVSKSTVQSAKYYLLYGRKRKMKK